MIFKELCNAYGSSVEQSFAGMMVKWPTISCMFPCHQVKGASNARQVPVKVEGGCDCHHDLPD